MTPQKAHQKVAALAKKEKVSLRTFCSDRSVSHTTVSKWGSKTKGYVSEGILSKLIGERK